MVGKYQVKKDDSGPHHYDPVSWIVLTDNDNDKVKVDRSVEEAMADWSTEPAFSK